MLAARHDDDDDLNKSQKAEDSTGRKLIIYTHAHAHTHTDSKVSVSILFD